MLLVEFYSTAQKQVTTLSWDANHIERDKNHVVRNVIHIAHDDLKTVSTMFVYHGQNCCSCCVFSQ